mmetsp:Transcript_22230/g.26698  ORF Transcript_22230/g.26698 Transcript_22230/m.26698 type:complete len:379 (+) Transcript_22230:365-1501(+)|eukprot:CAMPEP_0197859108 /NCGR_PEP_ID=MMETSP1438-20131217/33441_1 /TAXON_ID=1461541 /ORGANISM="Pterosperma sp., Strain CCMP1384" /LENGTH=378 /DNA_ID=CAMNT_0043475505 /DNA_START=342 /DNA_END=1478 /DNA_ORIENTATION=+
MSRLCAFKKFAAITFVASEARLVNKSYCDVENSKFANSYDVVDSGTGAPPFTLDRRTPHDEGTFFGRFMHYLEMSDPRMMFVTEAQLNAAKQLIEEFKQRGNDNGASDCPVDDEELWTAKRQINACVHPVSGDTNVPPLRLSGLCFFSLPICAGMLSVAAQRDVRWQLFWQWINQSYNSLINYANRSGNDLSISDMAQSYSLAVGASCGIAYSLDRLVKSPFGKRYLWFALPSIPCVAAWAAGGTNMFFSRWEEVMGVGAPVRNQNDEVVGMSQVAGTKAVVQTLSSRTFGLPLVALLFPPIVLQAMENKKLIPPARGGSPRQQMVRYAADLTVIFSFMLASVPLCISIYPQTIEFDPSELEEEFHSLKGPLYTNKGV